MFSLVSLCPYVRLSSAGGEKGFMRLKLYAEEPVLTNTSPLDGSGCEDDSPATVQVAGECGWLCDSATPIFGKIF